MRIVRVSTAVARACVTPGAHAGKVIVIPSVSGGEAMRSPSGWVQEAGLKTVGVQSEPSSERVNCRNPAENPRKTLTRENRPREAASRLKSSADCPRLTQRARLMIHEEEPAGSRSCRCWILRAVSSASPNTSSSSAAVVKPPRAECSPPRSKLDKSPGTTSSRLPSHLGMCSNGIGASAATGVNFA
ncbi:hypothetical protein FQR65_LT20092 [Abscondita terminalis]|nr:hypothetical protein FQR65_LT20092 [Abscondita terminalis]